MATRKQDDEGGDFVRSKVVGVRLDPKLRYLAEIAARKQRRTISSFIEWAIEASLGGVVLQHGVGYNGGDVTLEQEINRLWDVDPSERFARLAILYPELLTTEEQERWKLLTDSLLFSPAKSRDRTGGNSWDWPMLEDRVFPMLRKLWPDFIKAWDKGKEEQRKWVEEIGEKVSKGNIYPYYPNKDEIKPEVFDEFGDVPF
ncbi:hypothetical protein [Methylomagnum ishizawai]|uniref:hypothetical protein n=1 Tax=Methylomagnum ishizawai TaxID=1760988 RepID=UPI001C33CE09|nr:hypothetical protein [Methylomagnum ishizawai]BBL75745.1 hypothetical protein MishRS11D_28430 [Methylomagnum ishizawai]